MHLSLLFPHVGRLLLGPSWYTFSKLDLQMNEAWLCSCVKLFNVHNQALASSAGFAWTQPEEMHSENNAGEINPLSSLGFESAIEIVSTSYCLPKPRLSPGDIP